MAEYEDSVTQDNIDITESELYYLRIAAKNGDIAYREKPGQIIIRIRTKKQEKA